MKSARAGKTAFTKNTVAIVLPAREAFGPEGAGAISLVVRCHATASGEAALVLGTGLGASFPGIRFHGLAGGSPWRYGISVIAALRRAHPAVIEIHQQPRLALILARLIPRARVMLFIHNDPLAMRGLRSVAGRRRALDWLHRVVCVSDYIRQRYTFGFETPNKNLNVLHNPLNIGELTALATIQRQEVLYAGRIVEDKGIADFIAASQQALPCLPGWQARIIGGDRFGPSSPETPFFRAMRNAAAAGNIRFDGPQPHDFVVKAMAEAAIVVVPSRWPEPFGLTALEAMASGAALIASRTGALPEVAADAAYYVEPGDAIALAAAIIELAGDASARQTLVRAGLARARLFDVPVIAARLQELRGAISAL